MPACILTHSVVLSGVVSILSVSLSLSLFVMAASPTTIDKKRPYDETATVTEAPQSKVARVEDIKEEDIWPHESRVLSTLTVHVMIFNDGDKGEGTGECEAWKQHQTHLLHIHCIPGALAVHSKFFAEALEREPGVTDIKMPESFTWREVWKADHGYIVPMVEDVHYVFRTFHNGTKEQKGFSWELLMMYHYLDSSCNYETQERKFTDPGASHWCFFGFAAHLNSKYIMDMLIPIIKSGGGIWTKSAELKKIVIQSIERKALNMLCDTL